MTDDMDEDIVLTLDNEAGSVLGTYRIVTKKPADAPDETEDEEVNPNTGAPVVFAKVQVKGTESRFAKDLMR